MTDALSLQVVIAYAIGTAAALAGFWACPNQPSAQWLAVATVGFFLYGPQMLIGLCGAEVVSPSAVGASQGFLGWISYLGWRIMWLLICIVLSASSHHSQHRLTDALMISCTHLAGFLTLCTYEGPRP